MHHVFGSRAPRPAFLASTIAVIALSLGGVSRSPAQESKPDGVQEAEPADDASAESDDPFGTPIEDEDEDEAEPADDATAESDDPFGAPIEDEDKAEPATAKSLSVDDCIHELYNSDRNARWRAARRLRDLGPRAKQAIPALVAAIKDDDADVASMAAEALGAVGAATDLVVPSLAEALAHPDWVVRWSAAGALARIGPDARAADKALMRVINGDKDRDVKDQASRALARIKGKARKLTAK